MRQRDQFLHRAHRQRRMHNQHVRRERHLHHRRKILRRIKGEFRIERRDHREGRAGQQQRVTIGLRTRDDFRTDRTAGAGPVIDNELLAEGFGEFLRDQPPRHIGGAAGRKRNDQTDRA
jgi:hypothetical protein